MYLKLGTTDIKYYTSQDDFMIISEVIDSGLSYEKPVMVRTADELDIWFGRSFTDRKYFEELLESGVTLFLYKPINNEKNTGSDDYIDYLSYVIDPKLYYIQSDLPVIGKIDTRYRLVDSNGSEYDSETELKFNYLIWYMNQYVNVNDLPQNLDNNNSSSLNNRDTLRLTYSGYTGPKYTYPKYIDNYSNPIEYTEIIDSTRLISNYPDLEKINLGYETLAFDIKFDDNVTFKNNSESPYIIVPGINENVLVWFESGQGIPISVLTRYYTRDISIDVTDNIIDVINSLITTIESIGYKVIKHSDLSYTVYISYKVVASYFYNLTGFSMIPNFDVTHNMLSRLTDNDSRIEFVSKTIGTDDLDGLIQVNIVSTGTDKYRITISRYDYSEVFEGSLFGESRIDNIITQNSKLISCNVIETYVTESGETKTYKLSYKILEGDRRSELPTGTWKLRRAVKEDTNTEMYWKAVDSIFNNGDTVFFDYFLVPSISDYTNGLNPDYSYYTEYKKFLDYSKLINCQILIQNSDSPWKFITTTTIPTNPEEGTVYIVVRFPGIKYMAIIDGVFQETTDREIINTYGNNYVFNYTEDVENRLVYFFRSMKVYGNTRPGYYLFLNGLLRDVYSMSVKYIIYNSPVDDPYESNTSVESHLERYKSNYLVDNNQIYYYKKYQNGENFDTSIWMRFCLGKISRELEKNKWTFLSQRITGNIRDKITQILTRIVDNFSIIRRINISSFEISYQENRIDLTIETYMSDLIDNNISLDITLNYNKQ